MHLLGWLEFRICMNSCVDFILYLCGIYSTIILLSILDMWYTGVGICEIIGLIGLPYLWGFILPYMYNTRAGNITIYTKMAVEVVKFCCLLLY